MSIEYVGSAQLVEDAGITYRQLDHWTTKGYIRPRRTIGQNPGSGRQRYYTQREAQVLRLLAELVRYGLEPRVAAPVARRIIVKGSARLGPFTLRKEEAA